MNARLLLHIYILLMTLLPVSGFAAPVTSSIAPALNLTGVTAELVASQQTAFQLLTSWKPSGVTAIEAYDSINGKMLRAELDGNGNASGSNFALVENGALYVYSTRQNSLPLGSSISCTPLNLTPGFNLFSHACFPPNYQASQFIASVGAANIISLSHLDLQSGRWQTAAVESSAIVGDDFTLTAGEGYIIQTSASLNSWISPMLALTPATLTVQQGQPGVELIVSLPEAAPVGGKLISLGSSDPTLVSGAAQVTVPQGSKTVSIPLMIPDTGIISTQSVSVTASSIGLTSARASLSVQPKPTINLSPPFTLTGLTFTHLLTINLSDTAPPGGFPVTLSATPTGIVSVPNSIIIPAGTNSSQISITATSVGTASISATSPGRGISGIHNTVTVTPIQTMNYGPLTSAQVGVTVLSPSSSNSQNVAYGPVVSGQIGIVVGSTMSGVTPPTGATGTTNMKVTVTGAGLSTSTAIAFQPATGITVKPGSFTITNGNPEVTIDIDPTAPIIPRTVIVTLPSGVATPAAPGTNLFQITLPEPQILGMQPIRAMSGQMVSLNIFGNNLAQASTVSFTPDTGISVSNPPTINATGNMATVLVSIAANAPLGDRVVTITTPGWTSSNVQTVANRFSITADIGTTYTPLVSREVGIMVSPPQQTGNQSLSYGPVVSSQVGVVVGSAVSGVNPPTGATGVAGLKVTVIGSGLSAATAITFQPATGITIQPNSFTVTNSNPEVTIDIDPAAPTILRTVIVTLPSGTAYPAAPGANQFKVTLPEPQIFGMQPIRAMTGQTLSLNLFGKNFTSASSIDFTPVTGISLNNPPTVNGTGDMATVTVNIAANAPLGNRIVTISTPGWTSTSLPSVANTFQVTADAGTTYTPLISHEVGVLVQSPSPSTGPNTTYGPATSTEIGVLVTPAPPLATQSVIYAPIVSTQVGIAVGGVLTGISPLTVEPGSSTTVTLTGAGLNLATAIQIIPATGLTIGVWAPAADGQSGTLLVTADATTPVGLKTVVAATSTGSIQPAVAGANTLLVGYKPAINSISPILPTVGTTFTLTINGVHLQGATKVEILPANNVAIDSPPLWTTDGTGEHLTVKVIIDSAATPGDRIVVVTTPYGVTTHVGSPANTITFFKPGIGATLQPPATQNIVIAKASMTHGEHAELLPVYSGQEKALNSQREKPISRNMAEIPKQLPHQLLKTAENNSPVAMTGANRYLYADYRGPPGFRSTQESIISGG